MFQLNGTVLFHHSAAVMPFGFLSLPLYMFLQQRELECTIPETVFETLEPSAGDILMALEDPFAPPLCLG